jgi:hypothetical protein
VRVQIQDRLIAALRHYCQALPDQRRGKNTTYTMADFALAAFAPFFMHAKPVLPGTPAASGDRSRPVELRDPVRHEQDPRRQPGPRHA